MSKRFIDTGLFDDSWFIDLSKEGKIAWIYLITKCDHAGIIEVNEKLFKVQSGLNSFETVRQELGNRLLRLRDNYYFVPKFIYYQYPNFPNSNVQQQKGAIKRLQEFGLINNGSLTLPKELVNSYGNEYGNDIVILNKESKDISSDVKTWRNDFEIYKDQLMKVYNELLIDSEFIIQQEKYHPGVDISLSMEQAVNNFWGMEAGWKNKKSKKTKDIDWKATLTNAIKLNKVYKQKVITGRINYIP